MKGQLFNLKTWLLGDFSQEIPFSIRDDVKKRVEESFKVKRNNLEKLVSKNSGLGRAYDILSEDEREKFMMSPIVTYNLMYNWTRKDLFEMNSWLHLYLTWLGKTQSNVHYSGGDFLGEKFYRNGKAFYSSPKTHGIVIDLKSSRPDYQEAEEQVIVKKINETLDFIKDIFEPYYSLTTLMIQTIQISRPKNNHQFDMRSHYQTPGILYMLNPYLGLEREELAYGLVSQAFRIMLYYIEMCSPFTRDNEKIRETWVLCPWNSKIITGHVLIHECFIRFGLINLIDGLISYSDSHWAREKIKETRNGFLFNRDLLVEIMHFEDKIDKDVVDLIGKLHRIVITSELKKNPAPFQSRRSSIC